MVWLIERLIYHEAKPSTIPASRPHQCVIFPVVHKHKWYFNWFTAMYTERYFQGGEI